MRPRRWKETNTTLARAISLGAWRGMVAWRWGLLIPLFAAGTFLCMDTVEFSTDGFYISRRVDAWDLFPAMVLYDYSLLLLGVGFMLLVGDSYRREQEQGAVALSLIRVPSRTVFWLGEMGAVGIMALCFCGLGLAISFLVGLFIAPPLEAWPMLPREALPGMYPEARLPVPVYLVLLAGYTAWSLWVAGCAIVLLSLFIPRRTGVLAVIALWAVSSLSWIQPNYRGYARLLGLSYLVGFFKHLGKDPFPLGGFFAVTGAALILMAIVGSLRLRREEV
jgi:hypothetical protein